jgi:hypothetical protein
LFSYFISALMLLVSSVASAASLPPHGPLRILVVSDEVNPHSLPDEELTQPGDISAALAMPGSGLNIDPASDGLVEIPRSTLPLATAALSVPPGDPAAYDVLIYFAHRAPGGGTGAQEQADFVAAVTQFLVDGGGVVSFHHGSYLGSGKEAMQELIGATATGSVPYNTVEGQTVVNVAPGHFVTTNGLSYSGSTSYEDVALGIPLANYDSFQNIPDERYPQFAVNPTASEFEVLFASNYDQNGTEHLLGFTHRRPAWAGIVVGYQPGEYQPNALDDLAGNNFQVLANAIVYAAGQAATPVPVGGWLVRGVLVMLMPLISLLAIVQIRRPAIHSERKTG